MYVHVQMRRRMTSRRDWKLKSADWGGVFVYAATHTASQTGLTMIQRREFVC